MTLESLFLSRLILLFSLPLPRLLSSNLIYSIINGIARSTREREKMKIPNEIDRVSEIDLIEKKEIA